MAFDNSQHPMPEFWPGSLTARINPETGYHAKEGAKCIFSGTHRRDMLGECAKGGCSPCILAHEAALKCRPDILPNSALGINRNSDEPLTKFVERQYRRTYYDRPAKSIEFFVTEPAIGGMEIDLYGVKTTLPISQRLIPCNTRSAQTLRTVRNWLSSCDSSHKCQTIERSQLPRRLLDVCDGRVRLYESHGESGRYASLSHRWGTTEMMLCTTMASLMDFQEDIPWEILPRNFQDAVSFVRSIGLRYIWIDSLCIIQDSALDWQQQSAQMAAIYQNAYVTLAAAITAQPSDGLFTKEGDQNNWAYQTPVVIRQGSKEYHVYARNELEHYMGYFSLYDRGWVFQERLLSPRIVHFVGEELIWECREFRDCECGSPSVKEGISRPVMPTNACREMDEETHVLWRKLVSSYSKLSLTYESDALPALAGLASTFSRLSGDIEYAAGNWRSHRLLSDLLWYRVHVRPQPPGADVAVRPWRAPSWSWVSARFVPGEVDFAPFTESLCELTEVVTVPSGANPYGQLETAYVRIVTRGITTTLHHHISGCSVTIAGRLLAAHSGSHPNLGARGHATLPEMEGAMPHIFGLHNRDLYKDRLPLKVNILPLARYNDEGRQQVRYYLIIAPNTEGKGQWERVGIIAVPEHQGIYEGQHVNHTKEQQAEGFARDVEGNRRVFRAFEEAMLQKYTIH